MKMRYFLIAIVIVFAAAFVASPVLSQQIPAPGTYIDKSNYKQYAHLFPAEFLGMFEDGFGLIPPIRIKVVQTTPTLVAPRFVQYSAKNKGKYSIAPDGDITPKYDREGVPFPDLKAGDKDFAQKLMWNQSALYAGDDIYCKRMESYQIRRGEKLRHSDAETSNVYFTNRLFADKRSIPNPLGLRSAMLMHFLTPESSRDMMTLSYEFIDAKKVDETYLYLPAMRRVLRAEAGQRSVPLAGTLVSLDDLGGFSGRTYSFTYKLVGEQKVVCMPDIGDIGAKYVRDIAKTGTFPFIYDGWQVKDTWVVDVFSKDPKYPQSRKRLWLDKVNCTIYYAVAYDRAGKAWKVWAIPKRNEKFAEGEIHQSGPGGGFAADIQFGIMDFNINNFVYNTSKFTYEDFVPSKLIMKVK